MAKIEIPKSEVALTREDFASDQMVKWCPGCGDHAILAAVLNAFPKTGYRKENYCMVSGIGCSSRIPYYVNTYGFHGIHGRANAIASGVKMANPELSVWINTGDGDSLAIGGNHFIHIIRRNMDVNLLLFNNQIYGLTKGQYSPTTKMGCITKTSPYGTIEHPFVPAELVIGAQGTFYARALDVSPKLIADCIVAGAAHDGTSVIEILQNCVIFNDKTHILITDKEVRDDRTIVLQAGQPMIFGKNRDKGIRLRGDGKLEVVEIGKNGITEADLLVHDPFTDNLNIHQMLAEMSYPEYPLALGVIRSVPRTTYNQLFEDQITDAKAKSPIKCMDDLLNSGDTWDI